MVASKRSSRKRFSSKGGASTPEKYPEFNNLVRELKNCYVRIASVTDDKLDDKLDGKTLFNILDLNAVSEKELELTYGLGRQVVGKVPIFRSRTDQRLVGTILDVPKDEIGNICSLVFTQGRCQGDKGAIRSVQYNYKWDDINEVRVFSNEFKLDTTSSLPRNLELAARYATLGLGGVAAATTALGLTAAATVATGAAAATAATGAAGITAATAASMIPTSIITGLGNLSRILGTKAAKKWAKILDERRKDILNLALRLDKMWHDDVKKMKEGNYEDFIKNTWRGKTYGWLLPPTQTEYLFARRNKHKPDQEKAVKRYIGTFGKIITDPEEQIKKYLETANKIVDNNYDFPPNDAVELEMKKNNVDYTYKSPNLTVITGGAYYRQGEFTNGKIFSLVPKEIDENNSNRKDTERLQRTLTDLMETLLYSDEYWVSENNLSKLDSEKEKNQIGNVQLNVGRKSMATLKVNLDQMRLPLKEFALTSKKPPYNKYYLTRLIRDNEEPEDNYLQLVGIGQQSGGSQSPGSESSGVDNQSIAYTAYQDQLARRDELARQAALDPNAALGSSYEPLQESESESDQSAMSKTLTEGSPRILSESSELQSSTLQQGLESSGSRLSSVANKAKEISRNYVYPARLQQRNLNVYLRFVSMQDEDDLRKNPKSSLNDNNLGLFRDIGSSLRRKSTADEVKAKEAKKAVKETEKALAKQEKLDKNRETCRKQETAFSCRIRALTSGCRWDGKTCRHKSAPRLVVGGSKKRSGQKKNNKYNKKNQQKRSNRKNRNKRSGKK